MMVYNQEKINYSEIIDDPDVDDVVLPYGQEIKYQKIEELMNHTWKLWTNI